MLKTITETLYIDNDHIKDYNYLNHPIKPRNTWNKVIEIVNREKGKYIEHFIRSEFVENPNLPKYTSNNFSYAIARGTQTFYLDVIVEINDANNSEPKEESWRERKAML